MRAADRPADELLALALRVWGRWCPRTAELVARLGSRERWTLHAPLDYATAMERDHLAAGATSAYQRWAGRVLYTGREVSPTSAFREHLQREAGLLALDLDAAHGTRVWPVLLRLLSEMEDAKADWGSVPLTDEPPTAGD